MNNKDNAYSQKKRRVWFCLTFSFTIPYFFFLCKKSDPFFFFSVSEFFMKNKHQKQERDKLFLEKNVKLRDKDNERKRKKLRIAS